LSRVPVLEELREFLARNDLYVFTINGFPYGKFHGARVKEGVYLPDWRNDERLRYTDELADLLAQLLPDGLQGSVSTVPGAFKPAVQEARDAQRIAENLFHHVAHLVELKRRTGRHIALALEPEPCCYLETVEETVEFFNRYLFRGPALARLSELTGLSKTDAATAMHDHIGVCLDLCHAAVEFEDPVGCVRQLQAAGISIPKMQISSGLRLAELSARSLEALRQFDDPVYLHQVVETGPDGLMRYLDLPEAMRSLDGRGREGREWRVHCHVPVFLDDLGDFSSTQAFIRDVLRLHNQTPVSDHLEVETYTWNVLPEHLRTGGMDHAIARELTWVREELSA